MKTYSIAPCTPGAPDWNTVDPLHVDQFLWLPPVEIRMTTQICYDTEALYVRQRAVEKQIRAEHRSPFSMVCEDSCMEFFFQPTEDDHRFFNVEWNPNGCAFIGIGTDGRDTVRLSPLQEQEWFQPQVHRTEDGWEIIYRIPNDFVRLFFPAYQPEPGKVLRANCFKCGDLTVQPHYIAWNPVQSLTPNFHRSQDFGMMRFL